jgi:hypothetical protein
VTASILRSSLSVLWAIGVVGIDWGAIGEDGWHYAIACWLAVRSMAVRSMMVSVGDDWAIDWGYCLIVPA